MNSAKLRIYAERFAALTALIDAANTVEHGRCLDCRAYIFHPTTCDRLKRWYKRAPFRELSYEERGLKLAW